MPAPARRNPSRKKTASRPAVSGSPALTDDESEKLQNDVGGKVLANSRKRQYDISDSEDARDNKKARANNNDLAPSKPTKAKPAPVPRALPSRAHRNEHPGNVGKPRNKRTGAEVAAAKAAKEEKVRQLEELERAKKQILAEMEIDDEDAIEKNRATAVRRLSDMVMGGKDKDSEEYTDGDPMDEDESELDNVVPTTKASKTVSG